MVSGVNPPPLTLDQPAAQPMAEDKLQQALDWFQTPSKEKTDEAYALWVAGAWQAVESGEHEALVNMLDGIYHSEATIEFGWHGYAGELCRMLTFAIHYGAPLSILDDIGRTTKAFLGVWGCRLRTLIEEVYIPCAQRGGMAKVGEEAVMFVLIMSATHVGDMTIEEYEDHLQFVQVDQVRYPLLRNVIESAVQRSQRTLENGDMDERDLEDFIFDELQAAMPQCRAQLQHGLVWRSVLDEMPVMREHIIWQDGGAAMRHLAETSPYAQLQSNSTTQDN